ncbi:hypothetical protein AVEN_223503-1 [Araneus ventricosus]|uniref:Uncharacterized protein n=1 Tax=Araneus ventricosus TaxID=182803 RepID=A0A4Y2DIQ2_ARAVE|nr:hypothetical protein AVEN_223503-1 [Araneus ventricosus]
MESILVSVGRLKRDCRWEGTNFSRNDYQRPQPPLQIHPADFNLENKISTEGQPLTLPTEIYTDGSKLDSETFVSSREPTRHFSGWQNFSHSTQSIKR